MVLMRYGSLRLDQTKASSPYFDHDLDQSTALQHHGIAEFVLQNCHSPIQPVIEVQQECLGLIDNRNHVPEFARGRAVWP